MKTMYLFIPGLFVLLFMLATACEDSDRLTADPEFRTNVDTVSYGLGYYYGRSMADEGLDDLNYGNFASGLIEGHQQQESAISEAEIEAAFQQFQMALQQRMETERGEAAAANEEEARAFLEENAKRDDVRVTESGLQYRVIEEGEGLQPGPESTVRVHYRGTLIDGEEFDSSHRRGDPAEFPLDGVISGWTEGLQLMREGATYEFFVPSELGYGNNPPPGSPIQPGVVLIFEVELLSIVDQ